MYGGYSSGFDEDDRNSKRKSSSWKTDSLSKKMKTHEFGHQSKIPSKSSFVDSYEREEKKNHFADFLSMNAYSRHKKLVHDYLNYYGGKMEDFQRSNTNDKTDHDVIKEHHKFVWNDDDEDDTPLSWEKRLAKRYYDKLFKEYCICDLSRYKENKVAMRWRIGREVNEGKGQFICGARKCDVMEGLKTWEVNFGYIEEEEKKNALVKLRLCSECSYKLNYHHKHKRIKQKKLKKKKSKKYKKENKKKKSKKKDRKVSSSSESEDTSDHHSSTDDEDDKKKGVGIIKQGESSSSSKDDASAENIWKKPVEVEIERTRDEEFDDYFEDLFM